LSIRTPGNVGPDALAAVLYVGIMRVHMTFVTTVGPPLASVTPLNQNPEEQQRLATYTLEHRAMDMSKVQLLIEMA
jgi:hypothetical protein